MFALDLGHGLICFLCAMQGVLNCLVLAETVYRVSGENHDEIASVVSALRNDFPGPSVSLDQLQWSLPHVAHRYLRRLTDVIADALSCKPVFWVTASQQEYTL